MKTWETKKLGEVCTVIAGQSPEGKFYNNSQKGIAFYQGKKDFGDIFIEPPTVWTTCITKKAQKGDILMSVRAPVGPINISTQEICIGRGLAAISPKNIERDFLFSFLLNIQEEIKGNAGAVFASINKKQIENILVPLPSRLEQQKIVKKLDKLFAEIDKAKQIAQTNLQNAKEFFNSELNSIFNNPQSSWDIKTLSQEYDVRDGTHDSPKYISSGFPLVTSKNLKNGNLDMGDIKFISKSDYNEINERSKVSRGDILFAMIGTIGNPVIVEKEPKFAIKNVALFKLSKRQNSSFLKYYLLSDKVIKKMLAEAKGTTQRFVSLGYLRNFPIPIPSITEQQKIVAKLDKLSAETKEMEEIYKKKIEDLEELKKSLLKQAFEGKLV